MSYDLFVFEPASVPRSGKQFLTWYDKLESFKEGYDHNDPSNCTDNLRKWLLQMLPEFPAMNGPYHAAEAWKAGEELYWTDYTIGPNFIYTTSVWSAADRVSIASRKAAFDNNLGIFHCSNEPATVGFPDGTEFPIRTKPWWRFW